MFLARQKNKDLQEFEICLKLSFTLNEDVFRNTAGYYRAPGTESEIVFSIQKVPSQYNKLY